MPRVRGQPWVRENLCLGSCQPAAERRHLGPQRTNRHAWHRI